MTASRMYPHGIPEMVVRPPAPVYEPTVYEPTVYEPQPIPRSLVLAARQDGVQECLHVLAGALLDASLETPHVGAQGLRRQLDQHTIEALMILVARRTDIRYDGSAKR